MEKETTSKIKKKKSVLTKLYKNLPTDRLTLAKDLIERAAYMMVKLEEMEEIIDRDGLMMKMDQGKYDIDRAHPLLASYTTMVKSYRPAVAARRGIHYNDFRVQVLTVHFFQASF